MWPRLRWSGRMPGTEQITEACPSGFVRVAKEGADPARSLAGARLRTPISRSSDLLELFVPQSGMAVTQLVAPPLMVAYWVVDAHCCRVIHVLGRLVIIPRFSERSKKAHEVSCQLTSANDSP